jgi:hypothetical protein
MPHRNKYRSQCLERPPLEGEIEAKPHPCLVGSSANGTEVVGLESSCTTLSNAIPLLVYNFYIHTSFCCRYEQGYEQIKKFLVKSEMQDILPTFITHREISKHGQVKVQKPGKASD